MSHISREISIHPSDDWERIVERAPARTRIKFMSGRYRSDRARILKDYIHLVAAGEVIMPNCVIDFRGDNGMVDGFIFEGNGQINARFESSSDEDKIAQGLIIKGNTFRDYRGGAKRIRVASNYRHHTMLAHCTIIENTFENIDGRDNSGRPGGELISVKSGHCEVSHNTFRNCMGRLSIRGGVGSSVSSNVFESDKKPYGIQIYDEGQILVGNVIGSGGELRIGDGDSIHSTQRRGRNHVAADWAQVMNTMGEGRIIIQRRYRRYQPQHIHLADNECEVVDQWE